jgi:hypothetical protein
MSADDPQAGVGVGGDGGGGDGEPQQQEEPVGPDVSWSVPIASGDIPDARGGHTATLFRRKYLVVFGGHYHEGNGVFKYLNDVQVLNLENLKWRLRRCTGAVPTGRYGHSATLIGHRLYIFGGRGPNATYFKDVLYVAVAGESASCFADVVAQPVLLAVLGSWLAGWLAGWLLVLHHCRHRPVQRADRPTSPRVCACRYLDLKTWEWTKIKTATPPPPARMSHTATLVGSKLAVFGGWDGAQTLADFWVFATENNSWLRPRVGGPAPAPRQGHTATLLADGGLMIFGGYSSRDSKALPEYLRNTVELNLAKMEWTRLAISGDLPTPRCVVAR